MELNGKTCPGSSNVEQVNGKSSLAIGDQVKQCSKCNKAKPLSAFYFNQKKLKADSQCITCKKAGVRARRSVVVPVRVIALLDTPEVVTPSVPAFEMLPQDFAAVVRVFEKLRQWRDEANGQK